MAVSSRVICAALLIFSIQAVFSTEDDAEASLTHVVTLDVSNFEDVVSKHPFIVVEFYAPWCGHCKKLTPEYEKAAATLISHDPPIVLAKMDANEESNKALASKYEVNGFPTIKIFKNGGKNIQDYRGPREADGIVEYLKKQTGPPSVEIKSTEEAGKIISDKKVFIVGIFAKSCGEEFENFTTLAEKMRLDYDFGYTLDAKFLPKGESVVIQPTVRILKPFDELFVDSNDFHIDALQRFIEEGTIPLVTFFTTDPSTHQFVTKFFDNAVNAKVMLFANFSGESIEDFKLKFHDVAVKYSGNKLGFLLGDSDSDIRKTIVQYFGLSEDQLPFIIIETTDRKKYVKANLTPLQIADWMKDYMDHKLTPFVKSEPIPEVNDQPVKVVVTKNLNDMVYASGKNVLIEFYAPWCGHCKELAPILDEVAVSLENDSSVMIAKMDATANDVPDKFDVEGFPTLYFLSSTGEMVAYNGERTKDGIIDFIQKNKDNSLKSLSDSAESHKTDSPKDEL